ncbi:hypothetical protein Pfo_003800 [Paulownia fortunei]|nr:hypothetical protein Pfo_003800 [Paulownia fortunei]
MTLDFLLDNEPQRNSLCFHSSRCQNEQYSFKENGKTDNKVKKEKVSCLAFNTHSKPVLNCSHVSRNGCLVCCVMHSARTCQSLTHSSARIQRTSSSCYSSLILTTTLIRRKRLIFLALHMLPFMAPPNSFWGFSRNLCLSLLCIACLSLFLLVGLHL